MLNPNDLVITIRVELTDPYGGSIEFVYQNLLSCVRRFRIHVEMYNDYFAAYHSVKCDMKKKWFRNTNEAVIIIDHDRYMFCEYYYEEWLLNLRKQFRVIEVEDPARHVRKAQQYMRDKTSRKRN